MSSYCGQGCRYCAFRRQRDVERVRFEPEELARTFMELYRGRHAEGLFLSSGVDGHPDQAMERMLAAVELIRRGHGFRGYVHLKILPGAGGGAIERATALASRVSVNLEAPTEEHLRLLSPSKRLERDILPQIDAVKRLLDGRGGRGPSVTTQYVVGAAGESDRDLAVRTQELYRNHGLARAYYSGFRPVGGTPLENAARVSAVREHRLYQADWLLRFYGFQAGELPFDDAGFLPEGADPKLAWAGRHPEFFPVEVQRADRADLLRVPGIGPVGADRVIERRREGGIRRHEDLRGTGIVIARALPFIMVGGRFCSDPPTGVHPGQLALF
jgi:predicted DNA-binding helix-hairpin-helix protein